MKIKTRINVAAFAVLALGVAAQAVAQPKAFPEKSVRMVVPAPPGSAPDILARLVGQKLSESWGQPVVIDNIVGASGNIGTERVVRAPADGYTLLFNTIGPVAVNVSLFGDKLPYDPVRDLAPVSLVTKMPNLLTVNPGVPIRSLAELVATAKKQPTAATAPLRMGTGTKRPTAAMVRLLTPMATKKVTAKTPAARPS